MEEKNTDEMKNTSNDAMDELEAMFAEDFSNMEKFEEVTLTQSLEGFANCFPDWDLHPPVK